MREGVYDQVVKGIKNRKSSVKRSELIDVLTLLGFKVKLCSSGKHYVYMHPNFVLHPCGTFNGGHGKDPLIKSSYISQALRTLDAFESELRIYLREPS